MTSTVVLTALAMAAFAGNSILCRLALAQGAIDPASFSALRVTAGAGVLAVLAALAAARTGEPYRVQLNWRSSAALALYLVPFSFAYTTLSTGTGALILFGCVQFTILFEAWRSGERFRLAQVGGFSLAVVGLLVLLLPGQAAPPLTGALLMAVAGVAWGVYTLRGRGSQNPLSDTANNFIFCAPALLLLCVTQTQQLHLDGRGVWLALLSGGLASGAGYAVWYAALRTLPAIRAAIVQLSVPVVAAAYGVLFMGEALSSRLVVASGLVLAGIAVALWGR